MTQRKKRSSETKATNGKEITIAKIGLISAIVVAIIGVVGNLLPKLIDIQSAQIAPTQLDSQNATLPTDHYPGTFTPKSVPTAFFQDDFRLNTNNWAEDSFQSEYVTLNYEIINGKYRKSLTVYKPPFYNYTPLIPGVSRKNFDLTIDASIVEASNLDNNEVSVIIAFRSSRDLLNAYLVFFSNAGWLVTIRKDGHCCYAIFDWRQSEAFKLETGRINTFGISAKNSHFTISANGKELTSFDDDTLVETGGIGIGVGAESFAQTIVIEFDNLSIRDSDE